MRANQLDKDYVREYTRDGISKHRGRRGECWYWYGALGACRKYPKIMFGGKSYLVSSLMVWLRGRIEKPIAGEKWRKCHCHTCDNGRCVNPKHIFIDTQLENMHDSIRKGRARAAKMRARKRCSNGHLYTDDNTRIRGNHRRCRICNKEVMRRRDGTRPEDYREPYIVRAKRLAAISKYKLASTVERCSGDKFKAAAQLKISVATIYRLWHKFHLPTRVMTMNTPPEDRYKNRLKLGVGSYEHYNRSSRGKRTTRTAA